MTSIRCFMLTRTGVAYRWLRRYETGECAVSGFTYHNAMTRIDNDIVATEDATLMGGESRVSFSLASGADQTPWPRTDPRWPVQCPCGHKFSDGPETDVTEKAPWQVFWAAEYQSSDGKKYSIHTSELPGVERAPAGSMWYAEWWPQKAPDGGFYLNVRCPGNASGEGPDVCDWSPDGPSTTDPAPAWTRTGTPPLVTARPSIWVRQGAPDGGWHGWLTDGFLVKA